jgi:hypothetical protein
MFSRSRIVIARSAAWMKIPCPRKTLVLWVKFASLTRALMFDGGGKCSQVYRARARRGVSHRLKL